MPSLRGRPRASSRETLADAAAELFLEQGYEATTVTEITQRAGVSRSSFFNYFTGKSATLWFVIDDRIAACAEALADPETAVSDSFAAFSGAAPETLALAIVEARTMGAEEELAVGRATRQLRIADAVSVRLQRDGTPEFAAAVTAAAYAGAVMAAVWSWAERGTGRHRLDAVIAEALAVTQSVLAPVGSAACVAGGTQVHSADG